DLGFDIRVQYGAIAESQGYINDRYYAMSKNQRPNVTVDVLNGVQLTGLIKTGISTRAEGMPIQEVYTFIARDLNGTSYAKMLKQDTGDTTGNYTSGGGTFTGGPQNGPIFRE